MRETVSLCGEYIRVKREGKNEITWGGDQGFFEKGSREEKSGCGVIAFGDLLLYLAGRGEQYRTEVTQGLTNRILQEKEYKSYFTRVSCLLGGITSPNGMSGLKLQRGFNRFAAKHKWKLRARWGVSHKKLYGRIEEMLKAELPVILSIPPEFGKREGMLGKVLGRMKRKSSGTVCWFYQREEKTGEKPVFMKKVQADGHYVTVTGMLKGETADYLAVSSWGKKYYISWQEYEVLIHTRFLGTILGNILLITL